MMAYAGGKTMMKYEIGLALMKQANTLTTPYREVFAGGAAIYRSMLTGYRRPMLSQAWINDKDISVVCLWTAVRDYPETLIERLRKIEDTLEQFNTSREFILSLDRMPTSEAEIVEVATHKLVIQQLSFAGTGVMSGSAKRRVNMTTRSPRYFGERIRTQHQEMHRVPTTITNLSFEDVLQAPGDCVLYLDPPYVVRTREVYQHYFGMEDHVRLAAMLKEEKRPWVLSYGDHPDIIELYEGWTSIERVKVQRCMGQSVGKRRRMLDTELIISAATK